MSTVRGPRPLKSLSVLLLAAALSGCAALDTEDLRDSAAFQERAGIETRPVTRPMRAVSSFSEPLACMDRMLRDHNVAKTLITSKQIPDASGSANVDAKQMVVTTLSKMSRVSSTFRYVDYEIDLLHQDTVQTLTGLLLHSNQLRLQRPLLYVSGSLVYVDKSVLAARAGVGVSGSRLDLGTSRNQQASVIGLEMNIGEFQTRTLIPGVDSANEIVVGASGRGGDLSARIGRYGLEMNLSKEAANGVGSAVRTLVELGLIELVGKWAQVPYWRCLSIEGSHPAFQRQVRDWYDAMTIAERHAVGRQALVRLGYLDEAAEGLREAVVDALARFQANENIVVSGELDFPTYERLYQRDPTPAVSGRPASQAAAVSAAHTTIGKDAADPAPAAAADAATALQPLRPIDVELRFANNGLREPSFVEGRQVYLSASLSRTGYLACFHADAKGRVSRIFPNPFQPSSLVAGGKAIRLPDSMSGNQGYALLASTPGDESVRCYAGDADLLTRLPAALQGPAIVPLAAATSLADVDRAILEGPSAARIGQAALNWKVVPKEP